jgi:SAM-dependent methyltransferase
MAEVNLLDRYPRATRPIAARHAAQAASRAVARRFGREYFDGDRTEGYGGYRYDGRWVPVAERVRDHFGLAAGDTVLDVGCAKGFLLHDLRHAATGLRVIGIDLSDYALTHVMDDVKGHVIRATAERLPLASKSVDVALAINVLHNLPREGCIRGLRELQRVARRGAYVQVDSWLTPEQRDNLERWVLTAETYDSPDGWRQLFDQAGYTGDYYWTVTE